MTAAAETADEFTPLRRAMILGCVVLATTLYSTTLLIVSTILPQMQGTFSATADEIAWAMTFNILATAIVTPMTGWLTSRWGPRTVMLWAVGGFTLATLMCGLVDTLEGLVFWRIVQGAFGAPATPLGQSILMDAFPRRQHTMALSLYGFGVVIGPVIGPTFGGLMAEMYTWRWAFYPLVPVGVLAVIGIRFALKPDVIKAKVQLDWTGFITLSITLAAVQLVLARGQRLDWLESGEIILELLIAAVAFWVFVAHSLTTPKPFLDPRQLLNRNYAIGCVLVTIYGMLNFTPMVLLPPLLTGSAGYTDSLVGLIIAGRGVGGAMGFLLAGFANRFDARLTMMAGFGMLLVAGLWLTHIDLNITYGELFFNAMLQGLAMGLVWVPMTTAAFATVEPARMAESTAVYHLLRNLGSSFFISVCVAEIVRATSTNYGRMAEQLSPYNRALDVPAVTGGFTVETVTGLARLSKEVTRQATMIAYLNAFGLYTIACAVTIPLILLMRQRRKTA